MYNTSLYLLKSEEEDEGFDKGEEGRGRPGEEEYQGT